MEGLSERAYAARSGLSRGAVQKARKTGRLVLYPDGSINAAASDARRAETTDPDQQMRAQGGVGTGGGDGAANAVSGPGDSASYLKARTALTVYQAQERQLSIQRKKGVLVDRARAETLVFRLARQEREVWVTSVEEQSEGYAKSKLKWVSNDEPLPFLYESTGQITRVTMECAPEARQFGYAILTWTGFW